MNLVGVLQLRSLQFIFQGASIEMEKKPPALALTLMRTISHATLCEFGIHFNRLNMYRYLVDQLRNFPPVTTTKVVVGPWEKGKLKYREKKRALGGEKGELGISRKEGEDRQDAGVKETETSTGPETVPGTGSP